MTQQVIQLLLSLASIFILGLLAKRFWPKPISLNKDILTHSLSQNAVLKLPIKTIYTTADKKAAFVQTEDNHKLIFCLIVGDHITTREITPNLLKACKKEKYSLHLTFHDFTMPSLSLLFERDSPIDNLYATLLDKAKLGKA